MSREGLLVSARRDKVQGESGCGTRAAKGRVVVIEESCCLGFDSVSVFGMNVRIYYLLSLVEACNA